MLPSATPEGASFCIGTYASCFTKFCFVLQYILLFYEIFCCFKIYFIVLSKYLVVLHHFIDVRPCPLEFIFLPFSHHPSLTCFVFSFSAHDAFLSGEISVSEAEKECPYPYVSNPDPENGSEHGTNADRCIMECPAPIFSSRDLRQQWFAYVTPGVIAFVPSFLLVFGGKGLKKKKQVRWPFICFISVKG